MTATIGRLPCSLIVGRRDLHIRSPTTNRTRPAIIPVGLARGLRSCQNRSRSLFHFDCIPALSFVESSRAACLTNSLLSSGRRFSLSVNFSLTYSLRVIPTGSLVHSLQCLHSLFYCLACASWRRPKSHTTSGTSNGSQRLQMALL